jgi:hypothetical protein
MLSYLAHVEPKEEKPRVKDIEPKQGIEMKEDTKKLKMYGCVAETLTGRML